MSAIKKSIINCDSEPCKIINSRSQTGATPLHSVQFSHTLDSIPTSL